MKVYAIWAGEYPDEDVVHITDDYEVAKQYIDYVYDEYEAWIEEFDTDDVKINLRKKRKAYNNKLGFYCDMDIINENIRVERESFDTDNEEHDHFQNSKVDYNMSSEKLVAYVLADNKDQAKKIFIDMAAKYKYENAEYIQRIKKEVEECRLRRKDNYCVEFYAGKVGSFTVSNAKLNLDKLLNDSIEPNKEDEE